jgi:hypothetical protein
VDPAPPHRRPPMGVLRPALGLRLFLGMTGGVFLPFVLAEKRCRRPPLPQSPVRCACSANSPSATCFSPRSPRTRCRACHESVPRQLPAPAMVRPAHRGSRAHAGRVRARAGAHAAEARRDYHDGLRLLLHRLRAERPPPQRRGHQPHPRPGVPGEPRHGVPEGMGGARPRWPRPTAPPGRCCGTPLPARWNPCRGCVR